VYAQGEGKREDNTEVYAQGERKREDNTEVYAQGERKGKGKGRHRGVRPGRQQKTTPRCTPCETLPMLSLQNSSELLNFSTSQKNRRDCGERRDRIFRQNVITAGKQSERETSASRRWENDMVGVESTCLKMPCLDKSR
jgi:hypothetical protein